LKGDTEVQRFVEFLRSLWCRHNDILRSGEGRMWLECVNCGRHTPGFQVAAATKRAVWQAPVVVRRAA